MSWFDNQEQSQGGGEVMQVESAPSFKIRLPGDDTDWIEVNKNQVKRIYKDSMSAFLIILDEVAELLLSSGVKTEQGKEEDAMRQECVAIIQSITQLGRSAGVHMVLATQRNDAKIIPGVIQNNPLSINTKLKVKRKLK